MGTSIDRRTATLLTLFGPIFAATAARGSPSSAPSPAGKPTGLPPGWVRPDAIAMLIYPNMTALDLVGPHYMFSVLAGAAVHVVAKSLEPVTSDLGLTITPTTTFAKCPRDLTVLFAPGGTGAVAAAADPSTTRSRHSAPGRDTQHRQRFSPPWNRCSTISGRKSALWPRVSGWREMRPAAGTGRERGLLIPHQPQRWRVHTCRPSSITR